jgi:NADPH2:quinone reductase
VTREVGAEIAKLIDQGFVRPIVGPTFPLAQAGEALNVLDRREAVGKVVLDVG